MYALIDIGNTRTKWRIIDENFECRDSGWSWNDQFELDGCKKLLGIQGLKKIYLSNVGRVHLTEHVQNCAELYAAECVVVSSTSAMEQMVFAYQEMARLGVDRCLAMYAAYDGSGVMVIDAGSAITIDIVSDSARHLGGYILPGCSMLFNSLNIGTSRIGVDTIVGDEALGCSTEECVGNGMTVLLQGLFLHLFKKADKLNIKRIVITGGDAPMLSKLIPKEMLCKENLVLDGLLKLLKYEAERV